MSAQDMDVGEIEKLAGLIRGALIQPQDDGYDEARRVYNAMHDRRPSLIVQAAGVADVIAAVNFARENDLVLAVRGGGHSVPGFGTCDDGLVLDLGRMNGMRVDPVGRTVRAEGGCTLGDLNHATHAFGLATPAGIVSTTGIAGLTLGGGMGYLSRAYGLSCDNLISADVITANGDFVTCDVERETDLFWAIRGGGGNFGVVTSFEYRLHPVSHVLGGPTFYRIDGDVLRNYQKLLSEGPSELTVLFAFTRGLPVPFLPEEWHDKPVMATVTCWSGAQEKDDEITAMVSGLGEVLGQAHWRMPFPEINTLFDELLPWGIQHYWKATVGAEISEEALAVHWNTVRRCQRWSRGHFSSPSMGPAIASVSTTPPSRTGLRPTRWFFQVAGRMPPITTGTLRGSGTIMTRSNPIPSRADISTSWGATTRIGHPITSEPTTSGCGRSRRNTTQAIFSG
jgi:hypothetical protein